MNRDFLNRRELLAYGAALFAAPALGPLSALAQAAYPERPIKLVVPFAAGGVVDTVGRLWGEKIKSHLGTIVIENQGGGGGTIGAHEVARAAPDGYTLLLGNTSTQVLQPISMAKPPYDPAKDFAPIAIIAISSIAIVVNAKVPAKDLKELIAYAKANPGKMSYGSAGAGTLTNLAGEMFKQLTGLNDVVHVPYKGAGPGIADVVSGHIPIMMPNVTGQVLELHRSGKVRILAIAAPERLKGAPDIPTAAEAGVPNMVAQLFTGLFAPAATPQPIINKIAAANKTIMGDAAFQAALVKSGFEPVLDSDPAKARAYLAEEFKRWPPVLQAAGMMGKK
ncbi:MAG TPA: tripartite tricarboxylate transporter substrate binding protein [Xanthobacteraceae bacterium]|nr:tripartite tricarboxylate transporter substrate binding protein [Xanthobacteraceae bacterium]